MLPHGVPEALDPCVGSGTHGQDPWTPAAPLWPKKLHGQGKLAPGPTGVEIEVIMAFTPAVSSTASVLYKAIETVTAERHPGSRVMPSVATGFTDSHFTRDLGIASYGFDPIVVPEAEFSRIHGNDERVNVAAFRRGVGDFLAIINTVVYD